MERNYKNYKVQLTQISGTDYKYISVYKPVNGLKDNDCSSLQRFGDKWYGKVGTDPNKDSYDHLKPGSSKRLIAIRQAYRERRELAFEIAKKTFPELTLNISEDLLEISVEKEYEYKVTEHEIISL